MKMETIEKIQATIKDLQEKNIYFMKKNIRFLGFLFVNGIVFTLLVYFLFRFYDSVGFEKTLIVLLIIIFLTQIREQYRRA